MKKMNRWIGILLVFSVFIFNGYSVLNAEEPKIPTTFTENFAGGAFPGWITNLGGWEISDGVVKSVGAALGSAPQLEIGDENWEDFELEFDVKFIEMNPAGGHLHIHLRYIQSPETEARFYCDGGSVFFLESAGGKTLRHDKVGTLSKPMDMGKDTPWTHFRVVCRGKTANIYVNEVLLATEDNILTQKGKIWLRCYNTDVWFDNIKITRLESQVKAQAKALPLQFRNILPNSSFEYSTEPGLADYWGCVHWGLCDNYWTTRVDEWRKHFSTDETTAYEGKRSFLVNNPFDKLPDTRGLTIWSCVLNTSTEKKYTLSAYLKSDTPGMKIMFGGWGQEKEISLTTDWQRYVCPFVKKTDSLYDDTIKIYPVTKGTFWADAVQLEEGGQTTDYSASVGDLSLASMFEQKEDKRIVLPQMVPPFIANDDVVLDGVFGEKCWEQAGKMNLVLSNGGKPTEPTEARIFYTRKGIYLGVTCQDKKAQETKCRVTERDSTVWEDPSLEIFVNPDISENNYYHLALNQIGTQYDAYLADASWNSSWQVSTKTFDNYWTAEIFLPFGNFNIKSTADQWWAINIGRENHYGPEFSVWSPTYGGFHTPERFGRIQLSKAVLANYYFRCENARLLPLSAEDLTLRLRLVNDSPGDGSFLLSVSENGTGGVFEQPITLKQGEKRDVYIGKMQSTKEQKRIFNVAIFSPDKKDTIYSATKYVTSPAPLEATCQYNIYTKEKEILLRIKTNLPEQVVKNGKLTIAVVSSGANGKVLTKKEVTTPKPVLQVSLPCAQFPDGDYQVAVRFEEPSQRISATAQDSFRKLPYRAGEKKIDRFSRMIVVDGKPFIHCSPFLEGLGDADFSTDELLKSVANSGFTEFAFGERGLLLNRQDEFGLIVKKAEELGLKMIVMLPNSGYGYDDSSGDKKAIDTLMKKYSGCETIIGWQVFDEIFTNDWGKANYETTKNAYRELKEKFPYDIFLFSENQWGLGWLESKGLDFPGDVVSIDYYPYPPSGNIKATSSYTQKMNEMGSAEGKPVWMILLSGGYSFWASREFTAAEEEFSTYTSLINGATGIMYFAGQPRSKSLWEEIKRLNRELKELTPMVASTQETPEVAVSPGFVQILVKKYQDCYYLITVNGSEKPVDASFDLSGLVGKLSVATVMFEKREVPVKNNILRDNFQGYQRHVYKITTKPVIGNR